MSAKQSHRARLSQQRVQAFTRKCFRSSLKYGMTVRPDRSIPSMPWTFVRGDTATVITHIESPKQYRARIASMNNPKTWEAIMRIGNGPSITETLAIINQK